MTAIVSEKSMKEYGEKGYLNRAYIGELKDMVNELLGIQYNIAKADRMDSKVQDLASYINEDTLWAIRNTMEKNKVSGIDEVAKEEYGQDDSL